jgi:hypothetical protein
LRDALERRDESVSTVKREASAQRRNGVSLPLLDIGTDQIFPQDFDIGSCTDIGERQSVCVFGCQFRMIELLSGRLRDVAVDGSVSRSLFCAISLHHLTGNFFLAAENGRRRPVLTINDRKLTTFDGRHYDGSELRPIEILGDLIDIGCAPSADFSLIGDIHHQLVGLDPLQEWSRPRREFGRGRTEPLSAKGFEHRILQG